MTRMEFTEIVFVSTFVVVNVCKGEFKQNVPKNIRMKETTNNRVGNFLRREKINITSCFS